MRVIRGKIDSRPSRFIDGMIDKAVHAANGTGEKVNTTRSAGRSSGSFRAGSGGGNLTNPVTGKHYWTIGEDPLDDTDYVLK